MTTSANPHGPIHQSPQPKKPVDIAKKESESALKLLNDRRNKRGERNGRKRPFRALTQEQKDELELRKKQALAQLEEAKVMAATPTNMPEETCDDIDEVELEYELASFHFKDCSSFDSCETKLKEWMHSQVAQEAAPEFIEALSCEESPLNAFLRIANDTKDFGLMDATAPQPICELLFCLLTRGTEPVSAAAECMIKHFMHHPANFDQLHWLTSSDPDAVTAHDTLPGLAWIPGDAYWMEAWEILGYSSEPPVRAAEGPKFNKVPSSSHLKEARHFGEPLALARPTPHPRSDLMRRISRTLTHISKAYHQSRSGQRTKSPPPFGDSLPLATALCRTLADGSLHSCALTDVAAAAEAYLSMHAAENDAAWGRRFAPLPAAVAKGLPSSQAVVAICRRLGGGRRGCLLREAMALRWLDAKHGGPEKLSLDSVTCLPVLELLQKLPAPRDMLKAMTAPTAEAPYGWEVLSTVELMQLLSDGAAARSLTQARLGNSPPPELPRLLMPLLDELAKGLKNRRTVSVYRVRLFCGAFSSYFSEVHPELAQLAQAHVRAAGPISIGSQ